MADRRSGEWGGSLAPSWPAEPPGAGGSADRPPAAHAVPPARPEPRPRLGLAAIAAVAGLIGLAASLLGLTAGVMPRQFSAAEQRRIIAWEIGNRWREWPAGRIFPASIGYPLTGPSLASSTGLVLTAHRVGIAPAASCATATDAAAAAVLARHGCTVVLRATYADATGAFVTTIGVAVLSGGNAATVAQAALSRPGRPAPGVRAVAFSGTLASRFADPGRQLSASIAVGPYLVMYAAGYADGRPRAAASGTQYAAGELLSASDAAASTIATRLGAPPPPPHCPGAPGC